MKSLALIISLILSSAIASAGAHSVPEDGPDGLYIHHTDENGNSTYQYWGEAPDLVFARTIEGRALNTSSKLASLERRDGPVCSSFELDQNDANSATNGLAAWFGCGRSFKGKSEASYKSGSVVAFGCDYGDGQTYTSDKYLDDIAAVKAKCGNSAGWFAHDSWKSSYGFTQTSQSYC
ncbi:hypothetical protein GP486_005972 [Trichoglossum hirsutum]|uniref:Uncharacterized protein n=1 Tax=Trichoglossum hirsutum TaxID=265104 RepID=A0A9P8RLM4_9PEZI|nr:hypothetical protein GP486_005972 [Trichoglossum hirsutum]